MHVVSFGRSGHFNPNYLGTFLKRNLTERFPVSLASADLKDAILSMALILRIIDLRLAPLHLDVEAKHCLVENSWLYRGCKQLTSEPLDSLNSYTHIDS